MMTLFSSRSLQLALATTVYIMLVHVLSTCSTKECRLQLTDIMKDRSVIFRNIDIELCQLECINDIFISASCRQSNDKSQKIEKTGGSSVRPETHPHAPAKPRGSEVCNQTSECLEKGCGKCCAQAPSFCELHIASETGNLSKVKLILSQGRPDIKCKEWIGWTPVMLAAGNGHREVVELLVSKGSSMSLVNKRGDNILHCACWGGEVEMVKYILSHDMEDINSRGCKKGTPVMVAALCGHKEVLELLVGEGADVSLVSEKGDNILHLACRGGNVEVVKYILSQDMVRINRRGSKKRTPVMVAAVNRHKEVVELLVNEGADLSRVSHNGENILYCACWGGDVEVVKYVLSQGIVAINSKRRKKRTPMMAAALRGHKEVVELLVSEGADVSLRSEKGDNILHFACRGGHMEVVKYILSQDKVRINSRGWKKKTPVMVAAENGHKDVVELLVDEGADLTILSFGRDSVLHLACWGGDVGVVKYVLSQDMVRINSRGWQKRTPVMVAALYGHKEVVELLVGEGADVSLVNQRRENILHLACRRGHMEVVKYILSQDKVGINAKNNKGQTAAKIAISQDRKDMLDLLVSHGALM
ncbi:ankyrin-1-like [Haliotis rufescens]|uniref:ankyrin-1-like n=1 Tax=Haliotis rufescens TaxID=6454 RepID=UPI00201F531F|nr:ankyrin-1-like [Haliotis rufescens]